MAGQHDPKQPPPSFAPSAGRRRPDDSDAAVVGSDAPANDATRVFPQGGLPQEVPPRRSPRVQPNPPVREQPAVGSGAAQSASSRAQSPRPRSSDDVNAEGGTGSGNAGADLGNAGSGSGLPPRKPRRRRRIVVTVLVIVLIALIAWPLGLALWANGKIQHVEALTKHKDGPATTYLLAGSDSRAQTSPESSVQGARTDTILLLTVPKSGPTSLISIPRDTYVEIPDHGPGKINAAYSYGGPRLLVRTVEKLIDTKVDHYVEIGFAGVKELVDAVGGVRLCLNYNVDDELSKLKWKKGCHTVGGKKALAFSRMRYSDPKGDIGRAERQRQVISAIMAKVKDPAILFKPGRQVALINAGTSAVVMDEDANILTLGKLALAFRNAQGDKGVRGTPPISDLDYRPGSVGSTVLLDPEKAPEFFTKLRTGDIEPGEVGGIE